MRRALSLAIDRDAIVDELVKGGQSPAYSFTHPKTAGFSAPYIAYAELSQDERDAEAQRQWAESRLEGLTLRLVYNESEAHKQIATAISQMWEQKLGVRTELTNVEWPVYLDKRAKQEFDVARAGWCGDYNEASTFLDLFTTTHGVNDGKYSNETVDELMQASLTAEDPNAIYAEVEQILSDDMALAPIYHYANTFLLRSDIRGWPYDNVQNLWYSKNLYRVAN